MKISTYPKFVSLKSKIVVAALLPFFIVWVVIELGILTKLRG